MTLAPSIAFLPNRPVRLRGRAHVPLISLCLSLWCSGIGQGQDSPGPPELPEQLAKCREAILDPASRAEERDRWVGFLFTFDSPESSAVIAELLSLSSRPNVQRAVCRVLSERVREDAQRMHEAYFGPLLELLGSQDREVREASAAALSEVDAPEVVAQLGGLAGDASLPLAKRLAAVDALSPNTHRRAVVRQLIQLLDTDEPQVVSRATAALAPAAREDFGGDLERWRDWWKRKVALDEQQWIAQQLEIYHARNRALRARLERERGLTETRQRQVVEQAKAFQRELFRSLPAEQRDGRLVTWLADPLPIVKTTALSIIKAQIADEGRRPEGAVRSALLQLLSDPSLEVRSEALVIVENLAAPDVIDAVVGRLAVESDPQVRLALLRAVGKLAVGRAVPSLLRDIADPSTDPTVVRAAAEALGQIASAGRLEDAKASCVAPLNDRYARVAETNSALRSAILSAMAGVGDESFRVHFRSAIDSEDASVLLPAVEGLRRLSDATRLPRLRALMAHSDPRVRLAAIETVAKLGRDDADVEALLSRVHPATESNNVAREAAWRGLVRIVSTREAAERLALAQRFRDVPELEARYLQELLTAMEGRSNGGMVRARALDRLAVLESAQGKHEAAARRLERLFNLDRSLDAAALTPIAERWIEASVVGDVPDEVAQTMTAVFGAITEPASRTDLLAAMSGALADPRFLEDAARAREVLDRLRSLSIEGLDSNWASLLDDAAARLPAADANAEAATSPDSSGGRR